MKVEYLGNQELLQLKKAAFLASSTISSDTVLQVYDWATEMRNRGECVVSGFSSKLEQDVLHFLLKGSQPIIIVLARKMYKVIPDELKEPLAQNRLLIISVSTAIRQSNRVVCIPIKMNIAINLKKIYDTIWQEGIRFVPQHPR